MTTVARHYMPTVEMKKHKFIKNNVVEHIVKTNVEKATLIPHTNVTHGIDDDALPSPGVNPLEGSPKCSCGKLGLGRHSRLPAL
jgi:hypothetical protein